MDNVDAQCHLWFGIPTDAGNKKAHRDLPAMPEIARVRYQEVRLEYGSIRIVLFVCDAATGQSCISRMLYQVVSRRQAHFRNNKIGCFTDRSTP